MCGFNWYKYLFFLSLQFLLLNWCFISDLTWSRISYLLTGCHLIGWYFPCIIVGSLPYSINHLKVYAGEHVYWTAFECLCEHFFYLMKVSWRKRFRFNKVVASKTVCGGYNDSFQYKFFPPTHLFIQVCRDFKSINI